MRYIIVVVFLFFGRIELMNAQNSPLPSVSDSSNNIIFTKVDVEAAFPGGEAGWRKYLMQNLEIDKIAKKIKIPRGEKELRETIIVKFVVARNGTISDVAAENTDADPKCIAEAIRVINISPKWVPAKQNGRSVNAYRRQPITFLFER